jgi:hypothetical protein
VFIITNYTITIITNNFEIDLTDDKKFYNFTLLESLEDVLNVALTICTFFFPFRIYQFLAHFSYFSPAKTVINTFVRTTPGVIVFAFLSFMMLICWAIGIHMSMNSTSLEFSTYPLTVLSLINSDLQAVSQGYGNNSIEFNVIKMTNLFINVSKIAIVSGLIAFLTNLYKKAMIFEKGHTVLDPAKVTFRETVEEINDKITQIFRKSMNVQQSQDSDYGNEKVIAWLLNRSKESMSNERQIFFQRINQELAKECQFYYGNNSDYSEEQDHNDIHLEE